MDARDYEDAYQRDDKPREVKSNRAWRLECESLRQRLAECERERDVFKQCDRTSYDALATVTKQRDELVNGLERIHMKILIEESVLRQALDALEGINSICSDSRGVAGYHLNGDIAEWGEFDEMNQMDISIAALHTALDAATTVKKFVLGYVKQIEEQLATMTQQRDELVEALKQFTECDLNDDNCASLEVATRRIRSLAQAALAKLGADKTGEK